MKSFAAGAVFIWTTWILFFQSSAQAHPLNRYFIDHSARLVVFPDRIELAHTLDYGDATSDPEVALLDYDLQAQAASEEGRARYLQTRTAELRQALILMVNGNLAAWRPIEASCALELMPGRVYPFIRLTTGFVADLPALAPGQPVLAHYADAMLPHRRGMKDILVRSGAPGAVTLLGGSLSGPNGLASDIAPDLMQRRQALAALMPGSNTRAPGASLLDGGEGGGDLEALSAAEALYANDWTGPFPEDSEIRFAFVIGETPDDIEAARAFVRGGPAAPRAVPPQNDDTGVLERWNRWAEHQFETAARQSAERFSPRLVLAALAISFLFGCLHALSPGHGKTLVAAYLIGARGTVLHAVYLGLVVTITHTGSVFLLALLAGALGQALPREKVAAWTALLSGLLVISIGIAMLTRRIMDYGRGSVLAGHRHDHEHGHSHDHGREHIHTTEDGRVLIHHEGHTHEIPATASWWELLLLGVQGGLVPCPSALVVMLFGLTAFWNAGAWTSLLITLSMIIVFSIGLAGVLITVGILVVKASTLINRFGGSGKVMLALPIVSAILILVVGLFLTVNALIAAGVITVHF